MLVSAIIVLACFIGVVILILTNKMNRAVAAICGALVCYFVLVFVEMQDPGIIVGFLFGLSADGYSGLNTIILVLGMLLVVQICSEAGVFQFLAFRLIQITKGKPNFMLFILCVIATIIAAVLNNVLSVMIMVPLTIMISRILDIDPEPYILTQAVIVNLGATFFSISSVPNILIVSADGITFAEFFLNVGTLSLLMLGITLVFFYLKYRKRLTYNEEFVWVLKEYNARNFIPNVSLLYKSISVLIAIMVAFVIVPPTVLPPSIIALLGGIVLILISRLDPKEIIRKLDFDLLLYLLGVFVITGALETVGVINLIGDGLKSLSGDNAYASIIITLWFSAYLSANIDNIPITKVLIPVVRVMNQDFSGDIQRLGGYALAIGSNWGDNLTPMGDNLIVVALAEKGKRPIHTREFFKLGFITTNLQLFIITVIYSLILAPLAAYLLLVALGIATCVYLLYKKLKKRTRE